MSFAANFYLAAGIQANLHLPSSIHLPASIHTTNFYSIAATASERLLFSLGMGTLLAMVVWLLLRVFPKKDSRTSFAVWFATLLITAALPVASLYLSSPGSGAGTRAVITVPAAWA